MTAQRETDNILRDELVDILCAASGIPAGMLDGADDTTLEELGLESLAAMELQAGVKNRYRIVLPDDTLEMSLSEIAEYVVVRLGRGA
jgi:acyl carrier protein